MKGKKIGCSGEKLSFDGVKNKSQLLSVRKTNNHCVLFVIAAFFQPKTLTPEDPKQYLDLISRLDIPADIDFPCTRKDLKDLSLANEHLSFCFNTFKISQGNFVRIVK